MALWACAPGYGRAQSLEQWQRAIQAVGDVISDAQRRREAEEAAEAERERQEAQRLEYARRQQEALAGQQRAQQARAEEQRVAALSPPPRYGGRIVLHRQLLAAQRQWPAPLLDYVGLWPAWSPDDRSLVYLDAARQLHWFDIAGADDRVLPFRLADGGGMQFLGDDVVMATSSKLEDRTYKWRYAYFLLDRQGTLLGQGQEQALALSVPGERRPRYLHVGGNAIGTCTRISVFDAAAPAGAPLWTIDLGRKGRSCSAQVDAQGHHVLFAVVGGQIAHYRDGTLVRRFGSGLADDDYPYAVGDLPYVYTLRSDDAGNSTLSFWDLDSGQLACRVTPPDGVSHVAAAYPGGKLLLGNSSLLLSLPGCSLERLPWMRVAPIYNARGREFAVAYGEAGRVAVLDTHTWQPRVQFQADAKGWPQALSDYYRLGLQWHPEGRFLFGIYEAGQVQEFDAATGRLLGRLPGGASAMADGRYLLSTEQRPTGDARYRLWPWKALHDDALTRFMDGLVKDRYETSEQFRQRLAAASVPYTLEVALSDYDADRGAWSAQWQGIPLQVPMAPEQARRLEGVPRLVLEGSLQALDADYLELRQPRALMPDGQRLPLPVDTQPPPAGEGPAGSTVPAAPPTPAASPGAVATPTPAQAQAQAQASAPPPGCSDADQRASLARLEQEIAAAGDLGICGSGRLGKRLAEQTLAILASCPPTAALVAYRTELEQLRDDSQGMIDGACGD